MNWTEGTWTFEPSDNGEEYDVKSGDYYVAVVCAGSGGDTKDTAALISAAPELYEALVGVLDTLEDIVEDRPARIYSGDRIRMEKAKAALAKARGEV